MDAYDALPYDTRPSRATHPDRLLAVARWHGLAPRDAATVRVLELGCGTGWNVLPMAAGLPDASFVGLDTSQVQVDMGRAHAEALGLDHLELRCADLRAAPEGPFDVVIAHGLFSWVPPDVQDALLSTVRRVLAPAGVAFVSWNALPGWSVRQVVRDTLRRHLDLAAPPMAQVQDARDLLSLWSASEAQGAFGELVRLEAARLLGKRDPTLFHDYLAPHNAPVYVDTFRQRASGHGLLLLGEAEIGADLGEAGMLGDGLGDPTLGRDLLEGQAFHRTVLCRDDAVRGARSLDGLFLRARVRPLGEVEPGTWAFGVGGEARLATENPDLAQIMDLLAGALPGALDPWTLEAAVACEASEVHRLMAACIAHGFVEPLARAPSVAAQLGPRPVAFAPARQLAAEGSSWVPSLLHEAVAVDAFDRTLLAALDGACDQSALVAGLRRGGHAVDEAPARLAAMVGAGLFVP
jgi:SAM-dependent methyltransferase